MLQKHGSACWIPAYAGLTSDRSLAKEFGLRWIPACAGMTSR
jgi:hypothetical protein